MDPERFVRDLPRLFDDYPRSEHPRDRRFAPILAEVGGLACENNLALLNLAASLLNGGESYVEVGSYTGLSLVAAMLGNVGDFVGIDDFSMGDGSRGRLEANLRRYGLFGRTIAWWRWSGRRPCQLASSARARSRTRPPRALGGVGRQRARLLGSRARGAPVVHRPGPVVRRRPRPTPEAQSE